MFRHSEKNDIPQLRASWKAIFSDNDPYLDHYFKHIFRPEYSYILDENNEIVSSLQIHPYDYKLLQSSLHFGYFYAVYTKESYRNQGLANSLLNNTLHDLYNKEIILTGLIPATTSLFSLYEKYDFVTTFFLWEKYYKPQPNEQTLTLLPYTPDLFKVAFTFFDAWQNLQTNGLYKTEENFAITIQNHQLDNGKIYLSYDVDQLRAIIFVHETKEVKVREIFTAPMFYKASLNAILRHYSLAKILVQSCLPTMESHKRNYAMARIVNVYKILSLLAANNPQVVCEISIQDNLLSQNEGVFKIMNGECKKIANAAHKDALSIAQLTKIMMLGGSIDCITILPSLPYLGLLMD